MKLPSLLLAVNASVPLSTSTRPELLQGSVTVHVPLPVNLRKLPALMSCGLPLIRLNDGPSPSKSNVAVGVLLNSEVLLQLTGPPVQVPVLLLMSVPPTKVLAVRPETASVPLFNLTGPAPALLIVPAVQLNRPFKVKLPEPSSVLEPPNV